jgi:hypothetical protein
MRDGLRIEFRFKYSKGGVSITHPESNSPIRRFIEVAGDQWNRFIQTVGTSQESIPNYDVQAEGYIYFLNLDSTNFVTIVEGGGDTILKISPGKLCWFRTGPDFFSNYEIVADTAPCNVLIVAVDP